MNKFAAIVLCSILLVVSFNVDAKHYKKRSIKIVTVDDITKVKAKSLLVLNEDNFQSYFSKNDTNIRSIASITKLMTALVVVSNNQDMNEQLVVQKENLDHLKHTKSRLPVGTKLTRDQYLHLALIASENRAASVLGYNFPGGIDQFVEKMNEKATELGMTNTHFVDPTGLYNANVSTAQDLALLAKAGHNDPTIHAITQNASYQVIIRGKTQSFHNTNPFVGQQPDWDVGVSKTGFIKEAGKCLLMQLQVATEHFIVVILDATGSGHRISAAKSIKLWIENKIIPTIKSNQVETIIREDFVPEIDYFPHATENHSPLPISEYNAHTDHQTDIF